MAKIKVKAFAEIIAWVEVDINSQNEITDIVDVIDIDEVGCIESFEVINLD